MKRVTKSEVIFVIKIQKIRKATLPDKIQAEVIELIAY